MILRNFFLLFVFPTETALILLKLSVLLVDLSIFSLWLRNLFLMGYYPDKVLR